MTILCGVCEVNLNVCANISFAKSLANFYPSCCCRNSCCKILRSALKIVNPLVSATLSILSLVIIITSDINLLQNVSLYKVSSLIEHLNVLDESASVEMKFINSLQEFYEQEKM